MLQPSLSSTFDSDHSESAKRSVTHALSKRTRYVTQGTEAKQHEEQRIKAELELKVPLQGESFAVLRVSENWHAVPLSTSESRPGHNFNMCAFSREPWSSFAATPATNALLHSHVTITLV